MKKPNFQHKDPSLESQWRALILFGKNSATYKFAFAKSLLELINNETTSISLEELAIPFSRNIRNHLKINDKQGNSKSSTFLNYCRDFNLEKIKHSELIKYTVKLGFVNVVDAFQNLKGYQTTNLFYEKDYSKTKQIIITDNLLELKESFHFQNFEQEVEARWNLVETAWNLKINPNLIEVKYDKNNELLFIENDFMRRVDVTSARDSLNGYQKGKCFYSFQDISVNKNSYNLCHVDHFFPHANKKAHALQGCNINGVWNLVLSDADINGNKSARIPDLKFLTRLFNRNEFYIQSKHPLAETIINQTGKTPEQRGSFLQKQYNIAIENSSFGWKPEIELIGTF